jgi:hypothetical protein
VLRVLHAGLQERCLLILTKAEGLKMNKVFLGGTCNGTTWRNDLLRVIQVDYFNPVVDDWTPECQAVEEFQKCISCNIHLYVITSDMIGVFSVAEAVESAMTKCKQKILHIIPDGFSPAQIKSLNSVSNMVKKHGGISYFDEDLHRTARVLNNCYADYKQKATQ